MCTIGTAWRMALRRGQYQMAEYHQAPSRALFNSVFSIGRLYRGEQDVCKFYIQPSLQSDSF